VWDILARSMGAYGYPPESVDVFEWDGVECTGEEDEDFEQRLRDRTNDRGD
jgi:hypothetical protein